MSQYVSALLLCTGLVTMAAAKAVEAPHNITCSNVDLSSWGYEDYKEKVSVLEEGAVISMELQVEHYTGTLCIPAVTFGFTETKLWVNNGCRATFKVCYNQSHTFDAKMNALESDLKEKQEYEYEALMDNMGGFAEEDETLFSEIQALESHDKTMNETVNQLSDKNDLLTDQVILLGDKNDELASKDEAFAKEDEVLKAKIKALETAKNATENKDDTVVEETFDITEPHYDTTDDGVQWRVFQHRTSGSVDFGQNWDKYTKGFGTKENYWIGLDTIHKLCNKETKCLMRVDLSTDTMSLFAKYEEFYLDGLDTNFMLHLTGYSGTAGDAISAANTYYPAFATADGMPFSTSDQDNLGGFSTLESGWWYNYMSADVDVNGAYGKCFWKNAEWDVAPLTFSEMKLRQITG